MHVLGCEAAKTALCGYQGTLGLLCAIRKHTVSTLKSARVGIGGMCLYAPSEMHSTKYIVFCGPRQMSGKECG